MDAEGTRGSALISVMPIEHRGDEDLLKFPDGFRVQDSTVLHLSDE